MKKSYIMKSFITLIITLLSAITLPMYIVGAGRVVTIDDIVYQIDDDSNSATIQGIATTFNLDIEELVFPSIISDNEKHYAVTSITTSAFAKKKMPSRIIIPGSIISISSPGANSKGCFQEAIGIKYLEIQDGGLKSLPGHFFDGCSTLEEIKLPITLESIGVASFRGCSNLRSCILAEGIKTIGNSAFRDCSSLENISLANVETIESYAFSGCKLSSEIYLTSTKTIGSNAFCNSSISNIHFGDNLQYIDGSAFKDCTFISSVKLPSSLLVIGSKAFENCPLTEVHLLGAPFLKDLAFQGNPLTNVYVYSAGPPQTSINKNPFNSTVYNTATLHVPHGYIDLYLSYGQSYSINGYEGIKISCWEKFTNVVEDLTVFGNVLCPDWDSLEMATVKVKGTESHTTLHRYPAGIPAKIDVTPETGWSIGSVTFNGIDVTNQIDGNMLITEPLTGDNLLEVIMKSNGQTSDVIANNNTSETLKIITDDMSVNISGVPLNERITIYSLSGIKIYEGYATHITLNPGSYILYVANTTYKFVI